MACVIAIAPDGIAQAQVVERNLPPEPPRRASAIKIGNNDLLRAMMQRRSAWMFKPSS